LLLFSAWRLGAQQPSIEEIIHNSVLANNRDFNANANFNWKERDRTPQGSKTYQVTIIEGTPYYRLIALNNKPLPSAQEAQEMQKQQQQVEKRRAESPDERRARIAKFQKQRTRDNNMMSQLTEAFNFSMLGAKKVRGFEVWVLKATPKPSYRPPNLDTQVLTGMQGELWIDQKTSEWVHVHAVVIQPVNIEGFLAQVEPGTQFDLQKSPVANGIWQPSHYSMRAHAKVLMLFNHNSEEDETYWDYQPITSDRAASGN
jgi:hypothetical protein